MKRRLIVPAIIFAVVWGLTTHGKLSVTGDEPHYLLIAQSLIADRDLDLRNNYENDDARRFGAPGLQPELHARAARDGRLMPAHDIGLPVLLIPAYAAATTLAAHVPPAQIARLRMTRGLFAYSLISLAIVFVFCVSAAVTCAALRAKGISRLAAALLVVSVWLTAPVLSNAFLVFPEAIAIAVTSWSVYASSHKRAEWTASDWLLVIALGCLPWAHRKYVFYAFALLGTLGWVRRGAGLDRSVVARGVLLFAIPQIALGMWTYHLWGNVAGPLAPGRLPFSWSGFGHGVIGTLGDRENGLFWWAPAYAMLPAAWCLGNRQDRVWAVALAALFLPGAAHDQWWGGFSPAGRFLVPAAPIVCLMCARPLVRSLRFRAICIALLLPQFAIAGYGWQRPRLLWPRGDAENRILEALAPRLDAWAPSLRLMTEQAWRHAIELLAIVAAANIVAVLVSQREIAVSDPGPVSPDRRR
jgi:hypothetical protein